MLVLRPRVSGTTLTQWLYEEIRNAILDGRLRRGAPIPTTRWLASEYTVSRRIVVNVFAQLRDEGYLEARVGSGTRVSQNVSEDFLPAGAKRQSMPVEVAPTRRRPARPFHAFQPALTEFPIDIWNRLTGSCFRKLTAADLAGGDAAGYRPLRIAISDYLGSSRGVACTPEQIVVTSGAQNGLDMLARALLRPNDKVWVEDPGYPDAVEIFRLAGAAVVPVAVDQHGLNPVIGRAKCPRPKAIYLTPAHQFPLGVTLRLDRRLDLLQWTRRERVPVIEDDYDSEFRFVGKPVPAMKGLVGSEHIFLLGTFSKTLFPALRVGFVVVPDTSLDEVLKLRLQVERYPPTLQHAVLASFLAQGHFGKHVRRMRELYGSRLRALQQDVDRYLGGVLKVADIDAGLSAPAFLLNKMTSRGAAERARRRDLDVTPLDRYAIDRQDIHGLLLGFAAFNERVIRKAVIDLARALE